MAYQSARTSLSARSTTRAVPARLWLRAGPVPTAESSSASILPWSRERGAARSAQREREREPQKMDGVGSFGAGRAGTTIDPIAFAKQPQTILRVLSWVRAGFYGTTAVCVWMCIWMCVWWWWGSSLCCRCCARPVTCSHCKYRPQKSSDN